MYNYIEVDFRNAGLEYEALIAASIAHKIAEAIFYD
jgi:hypothetical protein